MECRFFQSYTASHLGTIANGPVEGWLDCFLSVCFDFLFFPRIVRYHNDDGTKFIKTVILFLICRMPTSDLLYTVYPKKDFLVYSFVQNLQF